MACVSGHHVALALCHLYPEWRHTVRYILVPNQCSSRFAILVAQEQSGCLLAKLNGKKFDLSTLGIIEFLGNYRPFPINTLALAWLI